MGVIRENLAEIRRLITGTVTPHAALAPEDKWVRPHGRPAQIRRVDPRPDRVSGVPPEKEHGMRRSCYPSDTSDAEWLLVEPMLPVPACRTAKGGRPEAHPRRAVWDAIRYVNDSGCK